jgi:hypothetical protein
MSLMSDLVLPVPGLITPFRPHYTRESYIRVKLQDLSLAFHEAAFDKLDTKGPLRLVFSPGQYKEFTGYKDTCDLALKFWERKDKDSTEKLLVSLKKVFDTTARAAATPWPFFSKPTATQQAKAEEYSTYAEQTLDVIRYLHGPETLEEYMAHSFPSRHVVARP